MSYRNKQGLFGLVFVLLIFFVRNLFQAGHHSTVDIIGLIVSALVGFGFGLLVLILAGSMHKKLIDKTVKITLEKDERLIFESPAQYGKRLNAAEGKLFLTDKRLFFKPHKFNFKKQEFSIKLTDILGVQTYQPLLPIIKGFKIQTNKPSEEKFIVDKLNEWFAYFAAQNYYIPNANKIG